MKKLKVMFLCTLLIMATLILTGCGNQEIDNKYNEAIEAGHEAVVSQCVVTDDGSYIFFEDGMPLIIDNINYKEYKQTEKLSTGDTALFIYDKYNYSDDITPVKIIDVYVTKEGSEKDISDKMLEPLIGNGWVDDILAKRNGTEISEPQGEKVSYSKGNGSISIYIPEGWEYSINETGDQNLFVNFSINFRPEGESGWAVLSCMDGFGVCGTGLDSKSVSIGDYRVSVGSYSGFNSISYMSFAKTPGDYIVEFENAPWHMERFDEIIKILSTATLGEGIMSYDEAFNKALECYGKEYDNYYQSYSMEENYWNIDFRIKIDGKYTDENIRVYPDGETEVIVD